MKINKNPIRSAISLLMLLMVGCILATPAPLAPSATRTLPPTATPDPEPAVSPTPSLSPTNAPTSTPTVPVFDSDSLGDNRVLDSFILTRKDVTSGGGTVETRQETIKYIKAPFSASYTGQTTSVGFLFTLAPYFLIDGQLYEKIGIGPWIYILYPEPPASELEILQNAADMRQGNIILSHRIVSAQFVGPEDFHGIPANHFRVDQTNMSQDSDPSGTYKITLAQGDLFLAQEGGYPLSLHLKLTGNVYSAPGSATYSPGVWEMTEELTSINQVDTITLPADFPALELDLGLPLPPGLVLVSVQRSTDSSSHDDYDYFMPATVSEDEFVAFYRGLAPTNGWTVSSIGPINDSYACQSRDCVVLANGHARVTLVLGSACVSDMPANDVCVWADYTR